MKKPKRKPSCWELQRLTRVWFFLILVNLGLFALSYTNKSEVSPLPYASQSEDLKCFSKTELTTHKKQSDLLKDILFSKALLGSSTKLLSVHQGQSVASYLFLDKSFSFIYRNLVLQRRNKNLYLRGPPLSLS